MTKQEQRLAIIEACWWKAGDVTGMSRLVHWQDAHGVRMLSDPLEDQNAMHAAVLILNKEDQMRFCFELQKVVTGYASLITGPMVVNATAAQRAEAFLRTIGKWKYSAPEKEGFDRNPPPQPPHMEP